MNEGVMPTPCASCDRTVGFRQLKDDPLEEYDMVCPRCAYHRAEQRETYEQEMEDYYESVQMGRQGL